MLQDQETLTQALIAEKEWLQMLTQKISEVQLNMKQTDTKPAFQPRLPSLQQPLESTSAAQAAVPSASEVSTSAGDIVRSSVIGTEAAENDNSGMFVLPVTAADAVVEAPARLGLALGAELADDEHYMVNEQNQRKHR